ncbi:MAG: putative isochorismatase family protein [Candidatus Heimdallarchaeota archaeon LC_3]|nr:MAG: putative isochorismatase family protein [Candidatus Heimdallarchaeota archaeon LC_3]
MAENMEFKVVVASDEISTFERKDNKENTFNADVVYEIALVQLNDEFATIMGTSEIIEKLESN